jgi:hypothetical protein
MVAAKESPRDIMSDPSADELPYRDWQLERECDKQFTRVVPAVKWDFFAARLRPLAVECAIALWERLFAGVIHPFHYQRAKGWMGKIFRGVRAPADYRGLTAEEATTEAFARADLGRMYVVYHWAGHPAYAAESAIVLDCLKRGWLSMDDTFVLCAEHTPAVALF